MSGESLEAETLCFPPKVYLLNQKDRFVWFSPEWNTEMQEVWREPFDVNQYIGHYFFDLLSGPSIRSLYHAIFKAVRPPDGRTMDLTLRCDHPPFKIILREDMSPEQDGGIKVVLTYISREPLDELTHPARPPGDRPMKMCSWCQAIFDEEGQIWRPLEKALGFLPTLYEADFPNITHGCCPYCYQIIRRRIHERADRG